MKKRLYQLVFEENSFGRAVPYVYTLFGDRYISMRINSDGNVARLVAE